MNNEDIKRIINHESRFPHFHPDFPLLLFWSPKSGCTSLANWFSFRLITRYCDAIQSIHSHLRIRSVQK